MHCLRHVLATLASVGAVGTSLSNIQRASMAFAPSGPAALRGSVIFALSAVNSRPGSVFTTVSSRWTPSLSNGFSGLAGPAMYSNSYGASVPGPANRHDDGWISRATSSVVVFMSQG